MASALEVQSSGIQLHLCGVEIAIMVQLFDMCWDHARHEGYINVWSITTAVEWFLLGVSLLGAWTRWVLKMQNEPYASLALFYVTASTVVYFVLNVIVTSGAVKTLSYFDAFWAQQLFVSHSLLNMFLHGRMLGHLKYRFLFKVDGVQVANNVVYLLLVEACALYLEKDDFDPEDLSFEFWMCLAFVVTFNSLVLITSYCKHVWTNERYVRANAPDQKDYSDIPGKELFWLKWPVAVMSFATFCLMVVRIYNARSIWTPTKLAVIIFYTCFFVFSTVVLYLVQRFRVRILKAERPVRFLGFVTN